MNRIEELVSRYKMTEHPEGGYYAELFRSESSYDQRSVLSSIYYLLEGNSVSHLHTIDADECWYHHEGGILEIHTFHPETGYFKKRLGPSASHADPFFIVPAGTIFGSCLEENSDYCLVSCAVAPAFEFEHFYLNKRSDLLEEFPAQEDVIVKLTRE